MFKQSVNITKMTQDKEPGLSVPLAIQELFDEVQAAEQCRDRCLQMPYWGNRKALWYAKKIVGARRRGWQLVHRLWPETYHGRWEYSYQDARVYPIK